MKNIFIAFIMIFISSCATDPVDLDNDVDCSADSFVGLWKYQSTNGVVLDSMPDIEIIKTDDESRGDIIIDGVYYDIKPALGCTAGEVSGLIDVTYELVSDNELHKKTTTLVIFGSTSIYMKK